MATPVALQSESIIKPFLIRQNYKYNIGRRRLVSFTRYFTSSFFFIFGTSKELVPSYQRINIECSSDSLLLIPHHQCCNYPSNIYPIQYNSLNSSEIERDIVSYFLLANQKPIACFNKSLNWYIPNIAFSHIHSEF